MPNANTIHPKAICFSAGGYCTSDDELLLLTFHQPALEGRKRKGPDRPTSHNTECESDELKDKKNNISNSLVPIVVDDDKTTTETMFEGGRPGWWCALRPELPVFRDVVASNAKALFLFFRVATFSCASVKKMTFDGGGPSEKYKYSTLTHWSPKGQSTFAEKKVLFSFLSLHFNCNKVCFHEHFHNYWSIVFILINYLFLHANPKSKWFMDIDNL